MGNLSKLTPEDEAKIVGICRTLGIPLLWQPGMEQEHPWTGSALNMAYATDMASSDLCHDIGHWIVAHPERRGDASFGLYNAAGWALPWGHEEEILASALGMLVEREIGVGDWHATWAFHCWDQHGDEPGEGRDWAKTLSDLRALGHLRTLEEALCPP